MLISKFWLTLLTLLICWTKFASLCATSEVSPVVFCTVLQKYIATWRPSRGGPVLHSMKECVRRASLRLGDHPGGTVVHSVKRMQFNGSACFLPWTGRVELCPPFYEWDSIKGGTDILPPFPYWIVEAAHPSICRFWSLFGHGYPIPYHFPNHGWGMVGDHYFRPGYHLLDFISFIFRENRNNSERSHLSIICSISSFIYWPRVQGCLVPYR